MRWWTREAIRDLITRRWRVRLSVWTVGRYLRHWGFTPQKLLRRAYERDPKAMQRWVDDVLVRLLGWQATVLHGDPLVPVRWSWLRRYLQPGPLRTLDAGCGSGGFTMYAVRIGNEAVGISYNRREIEAATRRARLLGLFGARFVEGDLRVLPAMSDMLGTFDQIICCETIEHILDDGKLLTELARFLRPGGRLLLTTPFKHARPLAGDKVSCVEDGGHVRPGYTHDEMRALLSVRRLNVVRSDYFGGVITYVLTGATRRLSTVHARGAWLVLFPFRAFQILDAPLTRLLRAPFMSIGIVAIKRREENKAGRPLEDLPTTSQAFLSMGPRSANVC